MIEITRPGKSMLTINTPVMPASGTFGYGNAYRDLVSIEKLGAIVTNPITYEPWSPATGTRVVPLDAGVLVHTGLPNPGLSKTITKYRDLWSLLPVPVILHLVATMPDQVIAAAERIDHEDMIAAVELGLSDDISRRDAAQLTRAAVDRSEKPILVRLPLGDAYEIAAAVADAGAAALVVAAPPRGTARDPSSGRLVSGRVYGPLVKPIVLRTVGQLMRRINVPIIGAGGIHSTQDARDYLEAGARAVQVDTVTWVNPKMLETIADDLRGEVTSSSSAAGLEWPSAIEANEPVSGKTKRMSSR